MGPGPRKGGGRYNEILLYNVNLIKNIMLNSIFTLYDQYLYLQQIYFLLCICYKVWFSCKFAGRPLVMSLNGSWVSLSAGQKGLLAMELCANPPQTSVTWLLAGGGAPPVALAIPGPTDESLLASTSPSRVTAHPLMVSFRPSFTTKSLLLSHNKK